MSRIGLPLSLSSQPYTTKADFGRSVIEFLKANGSFKELKPSDEKGAKPVMAEIKELRNAHNEQKVVAIVARALSTQLAQVNGHITAFISEKYPSIRSGSGVSKHDAKPDIILGDAAFLRVRLPYGDETDANSLQFGQLQLSNWHIRSSMLVIAEAKKAAHKKFAEAFGELCTYMSLTSQDLPEDFTGRKPWTRGLLFDSEKFYLLKYRDGKFVDCRYSNWDTPGSLQLLEAFLKIQDPWSLALRKLCDLLGVTLKLLSSQELREDKSMGEMHTPFLGAGRYGRAVLVRSADDRDVVLKIVIGKTVHRLNEEFDKLSAAYLRCPALVAQPVTLSFCTGSVPVCCEHELEQYSEEEVDFGGYLIEDVGQPITISPSTIDQVLRSLLALHLESIHHGDARVQNCIAIGSGSDQSYRWIDLRDSNLQQSLKSAFAADLETFFRSSVTNSFNGEQVKAIDAYSEKVRTILESRTKLDASEADGMIKNVLKPFNEQIQSLTNSKGTYPLLLLLCRTSTKAFS